MKTFSYIIIGGSYANVESVRHIFHKAYRGKAVCLGRFGNTPLKKVRNLGSYEDIFSFLQCFSNIQKIVYVNSELNDQEKQDLIKLCALKCIELIIVPREPGLMLKKKSIEHYYDPAILSQGDEKMNRMHNRVLKRLFDIVFSLFVIIFFLSWMIPIFAILIKLDSRGPVFFVQRRTGYFNSSFPCIKFRSMKVNKESNRKQATRYDPRLTKIGAFIRRHNIDEFPQFINVFLGHMSVVGPRPHMLQHTHHYARLISEFMVRHSVKPGITGWAQVNGYRGPTETVDQMRIRVEHDIWYIENWSFLLDAKCVILTLANFLNGEENAF